MVSNKGKAVTEKSNFRQSIENQVSEEVDRILLKMDELKFDANQVVLVLNSMNLPIPLRLRELVQIELVPKTTLSQAIAETGTIRSVAKEQRIKHGGSEKLTKRGRKYGDHSKRIANQKAKSQERAQNAANALRGVLSKGPVQVPKVLTEMKSLGFGSDVTRNGFNLLVTNGEARTERVQKYQGGFQWVLISRPVSLEQVRDASLKVRRRGAVYETEVNPADVALELDIPFKLAVTMMDILVDQSILTRPMASGIYTYEKPTSRIAATARPLESDFRSKRNGRGKTVEGTGRGSKMSSDKEVRQILQKAEAMGAQTKKQGNDHIAVTYKGETRIIAATPGDGNRSNREKLKDLGINV